jgi:thymidylate synthase (FAD)
MEQVFKYLEEVQSDMAEHFELDDMTNFDKKKQITSAMRRLAPIGLTTNIIVTANHRAWRHIIAMRVNEHAEEEIRRVMFEVASVLKERFPNIYQDMTLDSAEGGHVIFDNEKV